jgi:hypothetical protein
MYEFEPLVHDIELPEAPPNPRSPCCREAMHEGSLRAEEGSLGGDFSTAIRA